MQKHIETDSQALGAAAGQLAANVLRDKLATQERARMILATGASQFETLGTLVDASGIDWTRVDCFHLDEYLGLSDSHPASFRRYLRERFVDALPEPVASFTWIQGDSEPLSECRRLGELIGQAPVDLALIGIGENGHLAFNDPPADFDTEEPYLVVNLDEACRQQQLGEGWFSTLESVPKQAISMSVKQILKAETLICSVPDERKANAVCGAVEGPVSPDCPASILQLHLRTHLYLDRSSASLLSS